MEVLPMKCTRIAHVVGSSLCLTMLVTGVGASYAAATPVSKPALASATEQALTDDPGYYDLVPSDRYSDNLVIRNDTPQPILANGVRLDPGSATRCFVSVTKGESATVSIRKFVHEGQPGGQVATVGIKTEGGDFAV